VSKEELIRKKELATSEEYKAIKTLAYEYIKVCSRSEVLSKETRGMLLLIDHIDSWVDDYIAELANRS
jgi:hypothetical protein